MKQLALYSGNGVSFTPIYEEGRVETNYIRLVAEEDKAITNGEIVTACIDILSADADKWTDCELPEEEQEATEADYLAALAKLGVE